MENIQASETFVTTELLFDLLNKKNLLLFAEEKNFSSNHFQL